MGEHEEPQAGLDRVLGLGGRVERERGFWTRRSLPGGWVLALRFVPSDDEPVIAELRLFPNGDEAEAGAGLDVGQAWERGLDLGDHPADVPARGITAALLRELPVSADRHVARKWFDSVLVGTALGPSRPEPLVEPKQLRDALWALREKLGPSRRGRSRPETYYALIAGLYVHALRSEPHHPLQFLSMFLEIRPDHLRDALHRARVLDLLSQGSSGRAGGVLTEKGRRVLDAALEDDKDTGRRSSR